MKCLFSIVVSALCTLTAFAARSPRYESPKGEIVELWTKGTMPVVSTIQTYAPYMEFFKPEKVTTDAFLIVSPGGGYGGVAYDGEGVLAEVTKERIRREIFKALSPNTKVKVL